MVKVTTHSFEDSPRPRLGFVAPAIGIPSEPWMYRQLLGLNEFERFLLIGHHENPEAFPLDGIPVKIYSTKNGHMVKGIPKVRNAVRRRVARNYLAYASPFHAEAMEWLREVRPDVLLCQYGTTALTILEAARKFRIPIVPHFHGFDLSSRLENPRYRSSLIQNLDRFAQVVVVGSRQKDILEKMGCDPKKIHQIPCGVPTEEFYSPERKQRDGIRFLAVSRLAEEKGLEFTIRAFAEVVEDIPNATLRILGDGPLRGDLEALTVLLRVNEIVTFEGAVPPKRVREAMEDSDIFVQHSISTSTSACEGFGVSVAEAASYEMPIVASRSGGLVDQILDCETGFLVEERNTEEMVEKMILLAKDFHLRAKLGTAGRNRMVEFFDTKDQVRKLEEVLFSCLE